MKLSTKFSLSTSSLVLIVVAGVGSLLYFAEKRLLIQEMESKENSQTEGLAEVCRQAIITQDDLLVVNYISKIKESEGVVYGMFVDKDNKVIAHTDNQQIGQESKLSAKFDSPERHFRQEVTGQKEREPVIDVSLPVILGNTLQGTAHIGFSKTYREKKIQDTLAKTRDRILSVGGVSLAVGILFSFILALTMTRPIKKLVAGARQVGEGKLDTVIDVKSKDEIGGLAAEFNEMAKRLKELDRMKEDFISSVTHELRSPMTAIKGYVNLILDGKSGQLTDKQREYLTIVRNNTARLGRFINDILDLAKIEAGMMDIKAEQIKIYEIASEIITLMKPIADEKKVNLILDVPAALPEILADRDRIGQIITNLVGNALKFTLEGGSVTVKGEDKGEFIQMAVIDTGIGIPKDALKK
ncbi:MAG: histidine kinase dimerization/phospho-acceptor domain-containing protein, partial [Elusimicrobiota bacterium]|nr:histidine kinase dimerization/phospho-acceptor domain-containing protein [Elusimicrobiota bacterium]